MANILIKCLLANGSFTVNSMKLNFVVESCSVILIAHLHCITQLYIVALDHPDYNDSISAITTVCHLVFSYFYCRTCVFHSHLVIFSFWFVEIFTNKATESFKQFEDTIK